MVEPVDKTRLTRLLYPDHSPFETALWIAGWSFGVGYSIYNSWLASEHYTGMLSLYDLEKGWFNNRPKDTSDNEWATFSVVTIKLLPWFFVHFIGSQYFRKFNREMVPYFHLLISTICLWNIFDTRALLFLLIQPLVLFTFHFLGSAILVWGAALVFLAGWSQMPMSYIKMVLVEENHSPTHEYMVAVASCWINSRSVSFCLDHIWKSVPVDQPVGKKLVYMLSYCLYLPLAIGGPLINYVDYHKGITSDFEPWSFSRVRDSVGLLVRYSFWALFAELVLHHFYFGALQVNHHIITKLDLWSLCGTGYSMGQFMHLKYVVFYGVPRFFVLSDGIEAPPHPKCIGRIHLYSDMWRYFDNGLYKFMHRYIYEPVVGNRGNRLWMRLLSSMVCFLFVYIWHGIVEHVMIWSLLNNFGIIVENVGRTIGKNKTYSDFESSILSPQGIRRFHCMLGAPLYMMSILSNFYFFMGTFVGHHFVVRGVTSWPIGTPTILFFMYCGAQSSIEAKNWDLRKKLQSVQHLKD